MAIAYPVGLPLPLRDSYEFQPVNRIRRTPQDSGRARQRTEFTSVPTIAQLSWMFNEEQARLFEAWSEQVVGAGWFEITLLTPMGFDVSEVRFTQTPQGGQLRGKFHWRYSVDCELRTRPMLDPGWAELLPEWILEADIFDYAMNQEWPEA